MSITKLLKEPVYLAVPSASGNVAPRPGTLEDAARVARAIVNRVAAAAQR